MILPEEVKDFSKYTHELKRRSDPNYIKAEAEKMSELINDPRWERYGRHLETRMKVHNDTLATLKHRLENAFLNRQEYGETKVRQSYNQGCLDGLNYAMGIAKELIEQAEVTETKPLEKNIKRS